MFHDFQAISPPFVLFLLWPSGSCVYSLIILITTKYYLFHFLPMYFPPHQHAEPVLTSLEPIKPVHFPRQYILEKIMKRSQRSYHGHLICWLTQDCKRSPCSWSSGLTRSTISSIVIMIFVVIMLFLVIMIIIVIITKTMFTVSWTIRPSALIGIKFSLRCHSGETNKQPINDWTPLFWCLCLCLSVCSKGTSKQFEIHSHSKEAQNN